MADASVNAAIASQMLRKEMEEEMAAEEHQWKESQKKQAWTFQQKAAQCLSLDDMATKQNIMRRDIFKAVLVKNRKHGAGCMTLPVTIAFVALYCMSARLHEDITNVFLLESSLREKVRGQIEELESIDDIWAWIRSEIPATFFLQADMYGNPLPRHEWSRVLLYSQVQGSVILRQSRADSNPWGQAWKPTRGTKNTGVVSCTDSTLMGDTWTDDAGNGCSWYSQQNASGQFCALFGNRSHSGKMASQACCTCGGGFKVFTANDYEARANSSNDGFVSVSANNTIAPIARRRLAQVLKSDMFMWVPAEAEDDATYEFHLYPWMPLSEIEARLAYLQQRGWLDKNSNMLTVRVLFLNNELGRPRLAQMIVKFCFSRGGAIYWRIEMETLFLEVFPPGYMSKMADFCWLCVLVLTSMISCRRAFIALRQSKFSSHVLTPSVCLEWFIIILGWAYVAGLVVMGQKISVLKKDLEVQMRTASDAPMAELEEANRALGKAAVEMIDYMGTYRYSINFYCLILIFRFFTAFRVQPRLAVVTNTLIAVAADLFHFLFIFTPCFVAYVISGNILFGRRIRDFATITSSFGAMFRVLYENEYPWEDLSAEHFYTAAVWVWSFLVFVVLVMLNLVLAIILDTYNEVRQNTDSADTIFWFLENVSKRILLSRMWVKDNELRGLFSEMDPMTCITTADIEEVVPWMTGIQRNMIFRSCTNEMAWQAKAELNKRNLLKLTASVKLSIDEINKTMFLLGREKEMLELKLADNSNKDKEPPTPTTPATTGNKDTDGKPVKDSAKEAAEKEKKEAEALHAALRQQGKSRAFPGMQPVPGGYFPPLLPPDQAHEIDVNQKGIPEWLLDLRTNTQMLNNWMLAIQHQLKDLQWKWHVVNDLWEEDEPSEYSSRGDKRSVSGEDDQQMIVKVSSIDSQNSGGHGAPIVDGDIIGIRTVGGVPIL